jgi:hypothetical protein
MLSKGGGGLVEGFVTGAESEVGERRVSAPFSLLVSVGKSKVGSGHMVAGVLTFL